MGSSLSPAEFSYLAEYIFQASAILLPVGKEYLVKSRLSHLIEDHFSGSFTNLVNHLKNTGGTPSLKSQIIDAITTNETSFFRDQQPFEVLKNNILPKLITQNQISRSLNIWSAAASSGQEIYSFLMTLAEEFPTLNSWTINIYASDISEAMINRVQMGTYSEIEINRGLPETFKNKYFKQTGHLWQIDESLRRKIKTQQINLVKPWPRMPKMDLILLRNVLIYFSLEHKEDICQRMMHQLNQNGSLMLGASESSTILRADYTLHREKNTLWYAHNQAA